MTGMPTKTWEKRIADELTSWLAPAVETDAEPKRVFLLLSATGWRLEALGASSQQDLVLAFAEVVAAGKALLEALASPPTKLETFLLEVGPKVAKAMGAIVRMAGALPPGLAAAPSELPTDLFNWLTVEWLRREHRLAYALLRLVGVIRSKPQEEQRSASGIVFRTRNATPQFSRDALLRLLEDPASVLRDVFWNGDVTDADGAIALALEVWTVAGAMGLTGSLPATDLDPRSTPEALQLEATDPGALRLAKRLALRDGTNSEVGLRLERIPSTHGGPGALLSLFGETTCDADLGATRLELRASGGTAEVRVDRDGVKLVDDTLGVVALDIALLHGNEDLPAWSLGAGDGVRFVVQNIALRAGARVAPGESSARIGAELQGLQFVLRMEQADSFLGALVPFGGIGGEVSVALEWTNDGGLLLRGSGGLSIVVPLHLLLGAVEITECAIDLRLAHHKLAGEITVSLNASIGPVSVNVERTGLGLELQSSAAGGNIGLMDALIGFKPPTGAGLSLATGPITGGGFLAFDEPNARYTGVLALQAYEIGLVAIGLITTKLPDGSKGYSLLINIGVQFNPPLQLPLGFTLLGVGGLIGVNRTMNIEALQRGLRQGTLNSILFPDPDHVIENAAQIISDMSAVFPPAKDRVVIGPMVKLGWGSPRLITADIGIFLELPDPVRVALMGQLTANLPAPDKALVVINLDVLGVLDLEKQELTFQASLYDSRILTFALSGDAAFLLNWGDQPQFALSLGGFHPKFPTPSPAIIFADLRRLTLALSSGKAIQLTCKTYLAVTSNSIQFGARADLYASAMGASIRGHLAFDALFYLSPFSFEVQISAGVSIKYQGVSLCEVGLSFNLSGPTPWVARGSAKIKILFFSVKVRFCITWGRKEAATLPAVDLWEPLQKALAAPESWGTALPTGRELVESLREAEKAGGPELLVHPAGRLEVRQTVAPLSTNLSKAGSAPIKDHDRFEIQKVIVEGGELATEPVEEFFARGQFEDLSPSKKLAVPAFEKMPAGVRSAGSTAVRCDGEPEAATLAYESILIGDDRTSYRQSNGEADWEDAQVLIAAQSRRRAAKRGTARNRYAPMHPTSRARAVEERYAIVEAKSLTRAQLEEPNSHLTRMRAEQLLGELEAEAPRSAGQWMIVPEYEVQERAA